MDSLPPWRPLLRAALQREGRSSNSRWLQLATVASDGTPRVRTLVFRGWSAPAVLDLFTDGRSEKASELRNLPDAEICWLLPRARSQFRLRSRRCQFPPTELLKQRQHHWQSLTPSARALWGWPEPGIPLELEAAFPQELDHNTPMPSHFELLSFEVHQVELLELGGQPHRRRRWCASGSWSEELLNP
jgi:pyridoxamine 5'-phosphate oxidase